jgi:hypothetical protein
MTAGLRAIKFTVMDVKRNCVTVVFILICDILTATLILIMILISVPSSAFIYVGPYGSLFFLFVITSYFYRSIYRCYIRLPVALLCFLPCAVSMLYAWLCDV